MDEIQRRFRLARQVQTGEVSEGVLAADVPVQLDPPTPEELSEQWLADLEEFKHWVGPLKERAESYKQTSADWAHFIKLADRLHERWGAVPELQPFFEGYIKCAGARSRGLRRPACMSSAQLAAALHGLPAAANCRFACTCRCRRLGCEFHVKKAWTDNLQKHMPNDPEDQSAIYKELVGIMHAQNPLHFLDRISELLEGCA